ncbi:unnamed protein product [Symbiodinium natans]|uniref:Uncharacterized protein n=1 Tax=Symbiodinium natans TaxID=878477 RepID=A0A812NZ32_9DINO|nr:unnamed protein product [Symbiodinium natans]
MGCESSSSQSSATSRSSPSCSHSGLQMPWAVGWWGRKQNWLRLLWSGLWDPRYVRISFVYLEGWHRFVEHHLSDGSILQTEKHGDGVVTWTENPDFERRTLAKRFKIMKCTGGFGPYVSQLKRRSLDHHGFYSLSSANCGDYALSQTSGWDRCEHKSDWQSSDIPRLVRLRHRSEREEVFEAL